MEAEAEFWRLIGLIDQKALNEEDEEVALAPLGKALAKKEEAGIESFQECLSRFLFAIDGQKFAAEAGDSGQSDDGFLYSRCFVVAKGLDHYQAVINKPQLMRSTCDHWLEGLLSVAANAWSSRTGSDPEEWEFKPTLSYESGSNTLLWPS